MKSRIWILAVIAVSASLAVVPVHVYGQTAAPADQHADHHPALGDAPAAAAVADPPSSMMASMMATNARLDDLVKKMNAAEGAAKTDAIAELLTAIVQERHVMQDSMASHMAMMSKMMQMKGGTGERGNAGPMMPKK